MQKIADSGKTSRRQFKKAGAIHMWQEAVCGEEIIFGVVKLYD